MQDDTGDIVRRLLKVVSSGMAQLEMKDAWLVSGMQERAADGHIYPETRDPSRANDVFWKSTFDNLNDRDLRLYFLKPVGDSVSRSRVYNAKYDTVWLDSIDGEEGVPIFADFKGRTYPKGMFLLKQAFHVNNAADIDDEEFEDNDDPDHTPFWGFAYPAAAAGAADDGGDADAASDSV